MGGRRVGIRLEPAFWNGLDEIAIRENRSLETILAEVNASRGTRPLPTALRLYVTAYFQSAASAPAGPVRGFAESDPAEEGGASALTAALDAIGQTLGRRRTVRG